MRINNNTPKLIILAAAIAIGFIDGHMSANAQDDSQDDSRDPILELVGRLELESYKTVIQGLAQFGDRRQGTERNRLAVDWIEEQLRAAGCSNIERLHYEFNPEPRPPRQRPLQPTAPIELTTSTGGNVGRNGSGPGGSSIYGYRAPTGVNRDLMAQPNERIRELNREEPTNGPRSQVYCTKVGSTRPHEMYILGAHMDLSLIHI